MKRLISIAALAAALAACSTQQEAASPAAPAGGPAPPAAETRSTNPGHYAPAFAGQTRAPNIQANAPVQVTQVATGLTQPFSVEALPNGKFLVSERQGKLRLISADGTVSEPLEGGVPAVAFNNQGGLLDIALDPNFARNGMIYCSFSEPQADNTNNTAVFKAKLVESPTPHLENVQVIYHQTPSLRSPLHFGSRIVFGRDGTMFVTQGERSILPGRVQAQDMNSLLGKIVRINTDGSVPRDNPFVDRAGTRPEIWSFGHRNVQGAFLHPRTGELWGMEHAPQGGDELNIVRKGHDYGWPTITYGVEYPPQSTAIGAGIQQKEGMDQPIYYWDPVIAPGAMMFYASNTIPRWRNSIFVAGLNSNYVARLTMDGDRVVGEERLTFSDRRERYRDITTGPDGSIYLLTDGPAGTARLLKVSPSATGAAVGVAAWVTPPPPPPRPAAPAAPAANPAPAPQPAPQPAAGPPQPVGGPAAAPPAVEPGQSMLASVTLPAANAPKLTVTTAGWQHNADIPYAFTQYRTNTFPGLTWSAGPAGTRSYAIIMQDTDLVMRGSPILHWSVVNIPAATRSLPQGMAPDAKPAGAIYGPNYQGAGRPYLGPRTPAGPKHRYHMQVLALDITLPADFAPANYDALIAPMRGHVLAAGDVVGLGQADPWAPPPPPRPAVPASPAPAASPSPSPAAPATPRN
jgi:Raf kinase inhibitor-like YbhB/YbcL family protein